jgi:death-on-curing protein
MKAPEFLTLEEVLELHAELIDRYGGSAGVRDMGLLQSALASPQAGMGGVYFHAGLFEMAAAYLFHIVKNHPFVDGNKRTGAVAALQFLWLNGVTCTAPGARFETLILDVAESRVDKSVVAAFFKRHAKSD